MNKGADDSILQRCLSLPRAGRRSGLVGESAKNQRQKNAQNMYVYATKTPLVGFAVLCRVIISAQAPDAESFRSSLCSIRRTGRDEDSSGRPTCLWRPINGAITGTTRDTRAGPPKDEGGGGCFVEVVTRRMTASRKVWGRSVPGETIFRGLRCTGNFPTCTVSAGPTARLELLVK